MRGDRLRAIREQRELTQQELDQLCDLGANATWKYENGKNDPTGDVLARIAKELNVSSDYLLGLTDEPQQRLETDDLTPDQRKLLAAYADGDVATLLRYATKIAEQSQRDESEAAQVS